MHEVERSDSNIIGEKCGEAKRNDEKRAVARVGIMADAYYAHATMPRARIFFTKPPIGFPSGTCQGRIKKSSPLHPSDLVPAT